MTTPDVKANVTSSEAEPRLLARPQLDAVRRVESDRAANDSQRSAVA